MLFDICFGGFITVISLFSKLPLILNKKFNGRLYPDPGLVLLLHSISPHDCPTKTSRIGG